MKRSARRSWLLLQRGFAAHAGVVTLYSQGATKDHVIIVDPPSEGGESNELAELACVLEYYHNIYRLTHTSDAFCAHVWKWLVKYRAGAVSRPPTPPTTTQRPRPRVTQPSPA